MSVAKMLGLDKVASLFNIIRQNGGIRASLYKLYRQDELKDGVLVGEDKFGNKYYENPRYFYGRNRWVEYSDNFNMNYDGSQIPPEWFGWMHYKTDLPPHKSYDDQLLERNTTSELVYSFVRLTDDPARPRYPWMMEWTENMSGTTGQYTPYSTTRPKIESWVPPRRTSS